MYSAININEKSKEGKDFLLRKFFASVLTLELSDSS